MGDSELDFNKDELVSFYNLATLLNKEYSIQIKKDDQDEEFNKSNVLEFYKSSNKNYDSLEECLKDYISCSLQKENILLNWVNKIINYEIPVEEILEVFHEPFILLALLNKLNPDGFTAEDIAVSDEKIVLENCLKFCHDKYGLNKDIDSDFLNDNICPFLSRYIIQMIYNKENSTVSETEDKKIIDWACGKIEIKNNKYDIEWKNGNKLVDLLCKLDPSLDPSSLKGNNKSDREKWEKLKRVLKSRFDVPASDSLDYNKILMGKKFNPDLLSVLNDLHEDSKNDMKKLSRKKIFLESSRKIYLNKFLKNSISKNSGLI